MPSLQDKINSFSRWHYEIDLGNGVHTPIHDPTKVNRHNQRKSYFFDYLVKRAGGSLKGLRVLDLGCNAGFWSMHCLENGAAHVTAIDARDMHIKQAALVFDCLGYSSSRYNLTHGDVFQTDLRRLGPFDIVLCLGLLYHVANPHLLLQSVFELAPTHVIIDTSINSGKQPVFTIKEESVEDPRNSINFSLVLIPSDTAVYRLIQSFGYDPTRLEPNFSDYTGAQDYETGRRIAYYAGPG